MQNIIRSTALLLTCTSLLFSQEAPTGSPAEPSGKEKKALEAFTGKIKGKIVWATSRVNSKHDIWIMNADGTDKKALTNSTGNVDWFPRISPDGSRVMFTRSVSGWVNEMDAEVFDKWDIWTVNIDGTDEKKAVEHACWGTWRPDGAEIVFARGSKVFKRSIEGGEEEMLFDAEEFFGKKKVYAQQPDLSPNGKMLAFTVRGTKRETGVYNMETKVWNSTGGGCEMTWWPDNKSVMRVDQGRGNGGTLIMRIPLNDDGSPAEEIKASTVKNMLFMDLPGRRSHEYFPKIDGTGRWLVWCATQIGHEHDIADYEMYIWDVSTDEKKDFVRLTFHSCNDRWPDIYVER